MWMTITLDLPVHLLVGVSAPLAGGAEVKLECEPGATVRDVLIAAATRLVADEAPLSCVHVRDLVRLVDVIDFAGIEPPDGDGDADGVEFGVDAWGRLVVANDDFSNITVGDLLRAREDDLIRGDISGWILRHDGHRVVPLSDVWAYFLATLGAVRLATDVVQAVGDVQQLGALMSRRKARRYAARFRERGIAPRHLVRLIRRRRYWDTVRLARYLDITAEDAASLLTAAGYAYAPGTRQWVRQLRDATPSALESLVDRCSKGIPHPAASPGRQDGRTGGPGSARQQVSISTGDTGGPPTR